MSARGRERHILKQAVRTIAGAARGADTLVDEATTGKREDAILDAKVLRLELLNVKAAELERELAT